MSGVNSRETHDRKQCFDGFLSNLLTNKKTHAEVTICLKCRNLYAFVSEKKLYLKTKKGKGENRLHV